MEEEEEEDEEAEVGDLEVDDDDESGMDDDDGGGAAGYNGGSGGARRGPTCAPQPAASGCVIVAAQRPQVAGHLGCVDSSTERTTVQNGSRYLRWLTSALLRLRDGVTS